MTEPALDLEVSDPPPVGRPPRPPGPASGPLGWVRSILGIRRSFTISGVKYMERSPEPLARALSRRGSKSKEFMVLFPGGRRMQITVSASRAYEDLNGPAFLDEYRLAEPFIRPGMRVVALRSGTGYAGAWLAQAVGPSGSVVALDPDAEAIRYARQRYRLPNVSFEAADHSALAGEIDGGFDVALAIRALREDEDSAAAIAELWRVLAPGGRLIATAPALRSDPTDQTRAMPSDALANLIAGPARQEAAAHRTAQHRAADAPDDHPPAPAPPPPPNPELQILPAPKPVAAAMIRKGAARR